MSESPWEIQEWRPSVKAAIGMNIAGLVLTVAALFGFGWLYFATHSGPSTLKFTLDGPGLLGFLLMMAGLMVGMAVHELLHGLGIVTLGGRPRFGAKMVAGVMPAFFCTSPGLKMTKAQFSYVALLPGVLLALLPALGIAWLPGGAWLIVPAAFLLGGAVGDIAMTIKAWRTPQGTLIEDQEDGLRFFLPRRGSLVARA